MTPAAEDRPWWDGAVFYEIYVRSFQDSDADGVGDLRGITARVGYLRKLGIDAVWLTPFYPSPMADFGYDVAEYCDVDPLFGSLADFDVLRLALRAQEIRTIIDFVPNHTSDRHPWFVESRASRQSARRDWYVWRDPAPGGGPPNNWLSQAGGPAWTFDEASGQYYLHSFLAEQPDLNWRNPDVAQAMFAVMRFWLDRGVDGFRVDVLGGLLKDPLFRDDPPNPAAREDDPAFMRLDHVFSANQPDVLGIIGQMRAVLAEYDGDRVLVGELYDPVETLPRYYGENLGGVHLPFNFNLMWLRWVAEGVLRLVETYEGTLPPGASPTWVLGNHDHPRVATRLGPEQARIAMMLLLTLRGTPTLYQGDELGLQDGPVRPDQMRDPFARAGRGRGRDPQRTPMPWSSEPHHGFSRATPWLPVAVPPGGPVSAQEADPGSMLALTRDLLALRRRYPALILGRWRGVSAAGGVLVYERRFGTQWCRVGLNMTDAPASFAPGATEAVVALSTVAGRSPRSPAGETVRLRPHEGVVLVAPGQA